MNKMRGKRLFLSYINGKDAVRVQGAKKKQSIFGQILIEK